MSHDVFVSHSAKDKPTADAVCAILESNGVRCWIAPRDITPGVEWGEAIIEALEQSRIMVLVFSADANASPQIRREVERAVNHGVAILPLRIQDVVPTKALEYFIGNVHWMDALTPPLEQHLTGLAGTVKMLLARLPAQEGGSAVPSAPAAAPQGLHPSGPTLQEVEAPISRETLKTAEPGAAIGENAEPSRVHLAETGPPVPRPAPAKSEKAGRWAGIAIGVAAVAIALALVYVLAIKPAIPPRFTEDKTLAGHQSGVEKVAFSPDGTRLASSSRDGSIRLWDVSTGNEVWRHGESVRTVVFSPDGSLLAVCESAADSTDVTIKLLSVANGGNEIRTIVRELSPPFTTTIAFSPDGTLLAGGALDGTIKLWEVTTGREVRAIGIPGRIIDSKTGFSDVAINAIAFSPDGRWIAGGSFDGWIRVYWVTTGTNAPGFITVPVEPITSIEFSRDGRSLASSQTPFMYDFMRKANDAAQNPIEVYDVQKGESTYTFRGDSDWTTSVAFSPDGRWLATGSVNDNVNIWDVRKGTAVQTLLGHSDQVRSVAYSPDGKWIASGSGDKTIKLWKRTN